MYVMSLLESPPVKSRAGLVMTLFLSYSRTKVSTTRRFTPERQEPDSRCKIMAEGETNFSGQNRQGTSLGQWIDDLRCYATAISENYVKYRDGLTDSRLLSDRKNLLHGTQ